MKKGGKAQLQKAKTSGTEQTNKQNREEDVGRGTGKERVGKRAREQM